MVSRNEAVSHRGLGAGQVVGLNGNTTTTKRCIVRNGSKSQVSMAFFNGDAPSVAVFFSSCHVTRDCAIDEGKCANSVDTSSDICSVARDCAVGDHERANVIDAAAYRGSLEGRGTRRIVRYGAVFESECTLIVDATAIGTAKGGISSIARDDSVDESEGTAIVNAPLTPPISW